MSKYSDYKKERPVLSRYYQSDHAGRQASNTIFCDSIVGNRIPQVAVQFQYNIASADVTDLSTGTATVTQNLSRAVLNSGASGLAKIQSVKSIRYIPGFDGYAYFTAQFETAGNGSYAEIGPATNENGIFIKYVDRGNGPELAAVRRFNGIDDIVYQSDFNVDTLNGIVYESGMNINHDAINIFRINYGWLGIAPLVFEIYAGVERGWIVFHVFDLTNLQEHVTILNPVLPVKAECGGAQNVILRTASWQGGTIGIDTFITARFGSAVNHDVAVPSNTITNIVSIKSKTIFQSIESLISSELMFLSASVDGSKTTVISVVKNGTIAGAVWTDNDPVNSVMEISKTAGVVTGGEILMSAVMSKISSDSFDSRGLGFYIMPGDTISITAESTASVDVSCSVRFCENF